jgi:uncharacterized protein YdiU (UPF0061 family)
MLLGFIHGVMNTDNTSISGETLDYGPCAFMEAFDPAQVFSSIDRGGRYAYQNQPYAAHWNLSRLAEALLPLLVEEEGSQDAALASAREALEAFMPQFETARIAGLLCKLGLFTPQEADATLAEDLLERMAANQADFTLTFRSLCDAAQTGENAAVRHLFADPTAYDCWASAWHHRLQQETFSPAERAAAMRRANPAYIPRNHLVEAVIVAAVERQDFQPFEQLLDVVTQPWDERPGLELYATPAQPEQRVTATFCGT